MFFASGTGRKEVLDMLIVLENSPIKLQGDWANLGTGIPGDFFIRDIESHGRQNTEVCNLLDEVYFSTRRLPEFKDYERLEKWFASLDENAELTDEVMRKADTLQGDRGSFSGVGIRETTGNHGGTSVIGRRQRCT